MKLNVAHRTPGIAMRLEQVREIDAVVDQEGRNYDVADSRIMAVRAGCRLDLFAVIFKC